MEKFTLKGQAVCTYCGEHFPTYTNFQVLKFSFNFTLSNN